MSHIQHRYQIAYDMEMATICVYPPSQHTFPHWNYLLHHFENFPCIDLTSQQLYKHHSNTCPTMSFHVYHLIARCTVQGRRLFYKNKSCVCVIPHLCHPQKYIHKNSVLLLRHQIMTFTPFSTFQKYKY